jgi:glycosyltransferase involved in cell wall biosynthesis
MVKKNTYRRYPGLRGRLKRWVAAMGIERVDRFICASDMTARLYQREFGVERDRLTVATHIGVDTDAFRPAPGSLDRGDGSVVGYCGRLAVDKGITDLLEAVAICRSRSGLDVRLLLLGAGPLHGHLASYVLGHRWLEVLPPVPNHRVHEFLSVIDVFALPSRVLPDHEEHDAHALTEALAAGVPTVGTRSGIIPELLGDGTGFLVEPEDPRELAESLRRLLTSRKLQAELGERGRAKAIRCFALARVARERVSVYRSVLADTYGTQVAQ